MDHLFPPIFDVSNVDMWKFSMSAYLKNLSLHVYLATTKKTYFGNDKYFEANAQALDALKHTLSKEYLCIVSHCVSAFAVWNTLTSPMQQTTNNIAHACNKPILTCLLVSGRLFHWHEINTDHDWAFWYEILRINVRWYCDSVITENKSRKLTITFWESIRGYFIRLWIYNHDRFTLTFGLHDTDITCTTLYLSLDIVTVYIVPWSWYTLYSLSGTDILNF